MCENPVRRNKAPVPYTRLSTFQSTQASGDQRQTCGSFWRHGHVRQAARVQDQEKEIGNFTAWSFWRVNVALFRFSISQGMSRDKGKIPGARCHNSYAICVDEDASAPVILIHIEPCKGHTPAIVHDGCFNVSSRHHPVGRMLGTCWYHFNSRLSLFRGVTYYLAGGLEHFLFFHRLGIIIPTD